MPNASTTPLVIPSAPGIRVPARVLPARTQSFRIGELEWIPINVPICVQAASEANRIRFNVPANCSVVVAPRVVMQPRFLVEVLPRIPQVELEGDGVVVWILIRRIHPERLLLLPLPDGFLGLIGHQAWRVQMIRVIGSAENF